MPKNWKNWNEISGDRLTNLEVCCWEKKIQGSLDSPEGEAAEQELVKSIPKRLKSEGKKAQIAATFHGAVSRTGVSNS